MARLFVFDCQGCSNVVLKRVEFTPPSNSTETSTGRFKIDLSKPSDHNGYPSQVIECAHCGTQVESKEYTLGSIPSVYFNYIGADE